VALIGKVGSGKSSLLSCLSGELYQKLGTSIKLCGSMAYVSQKAWISSKSIKENILFERPYDEKRY
jgi:ABC-type transport system involved in cytochrome bd biosynthesis fused ATPase/permease subunit